MKVTVKMLLAMMMVVSMAAWAQRGPPPSADEMVQRMTEHLGLSADQQVALRDLLEQNRPEPGADPEAGRAAVDAGLESILTAEQLEKFRTARQSRGGHPPGGPGQGQGGRQ